MDDRPERITTVRAEVESLLPSLGLAYVTDGARRWGVTRAQLGTHFDGLAPGGRVTLQVQSQFGASLVRSCESAD